MQGRHEFPINSKGNDTTVRDSAETGIKQPNSYIVAPIS